MADTPISEVVKSATAETTSTADTATTTDTTSNTTDTTSTDTAVKTTTTTATKTNTLTTGTLSSTSKTTVAKLASPIEVPEVEAPVYPAAIKLAPVIDNHAATFTASTSTVASTDLPTGYSTTTASMTDNQIIAKLQTYFKTCVENNKAGQGKQTAAMTKTYIKSFATAISLALSKPTYAVLLEVYNFFKAHRNDILQFKYALIGNDQLPKELRMTISIFYNVFYGITANPVKEMNTEVIRKIFKSSGDGVLNFMVRMGVTS